MEFSIGAMLLMTILSLGNVAARPWNLGPSRYETYWSDREYGIPSHNYANYFGDNGMKMSDNDRYRDGVKSYFPSKGSRVGWYERKPDFEEQYIDSGDDDELSMMEDTDRDVDALGNININEIYDALSDWIEEKEAGESRMEMRENIMMEEPSSHPPSLDGNDIDREGSFGAVVDKLFKISGGKQITRPLQIEMGIRDLSLEDDGEFEELEYQGVGDGDKDVEQEIKKVEILPSGDQSLNGNGVGLTNGLTLEKAHSLLEQLKKAEVEKTAAPHSYEQVDKQSLDDLLSGDKRLKEQVDTTPQPELVDTTPLTSGDNGSNYKIPKSYEALKLKAQLLQEENSMLIEALDSFTDLPLEYFEKAEDIRYVKRLLERAALRQEAVEYIDANSN